MKTEKPRKSQTQTRSLKSQPAKAGIKMQSGLRAGRQMGYTDKY